MARSERLVLSESAVSPRYHTQRTIPRSLRITVPLDVSRNPNGTSRSKCALAVVKRSIALVAIVATIASLTSCAQPDSHPFLGAPYDGPTAAYGYNYP